MNNTNEFTSAGIFLAKAWLIGSIKDENGLISIKNDSVGLTIRFTKAEENCVLEHDFWIPSQEYRKLCEALDIVKGHKIGGQLIGKQLWICIREVHDSGNIRYEAFDWIKCTDPNVRPIISGDPIQHKEGKPLGVFLNTIMGTRTVEGESTYEVKAGLPTDKTFENEMLLNNQILVSKVGIPFCEDLKGKSAEERIAAGKAIIENAKNNKSVETSEENDPWADM